MKRIHFPPSLARFMLRFFKRFSYVFCFVSRLERVFFFCFFWFFCIFFGVPPRFVAIARLGMYMNGYRTSFGLEEGVD